MEQVFRIHFVISTDFSTRYSQFRILEASLIRNQQNSVHVCLCMSNSRTALRSRKQQQQQKREEYFILKQQRCFTPPKRRFQTRCRLGGVNMCTLIHIHAQMHSHKHKRIYRVCTYTDPNQFHSSGNNLDYLYAYVRARIYFTKKCKHVIARLSYSSDDGKSFFQASTLGHKHNERKHAHIYHPCWCLRLLLSVSHSYLVSAPLFVWVSECMYVS